MEVNKSYIELLLQLLNNEENVNIEAYQEELIVNIYLTLLSLSNLEYTEKLDDKEKEIIRDFLTRLCNLKVKIQLKRKAEEITKLAEDLITQYYENINILSIYIKDGIELENVINTMDAKSLTSLIDVTTKDKIKKEDKEEERNKRRSELIKLIPNNEYYIENGIIFIENEDKYEEITIKDFLEMFSYLLNIDNYKKIYKNDSKQRSHELIITTMIKTLVVKEKKQEHPDRILIPLLLTYLLSQKITEHIDLDTSKFIIENIKISELYSLASNNQSNNTNTPKSGNIYIPNEYFLNKLKDMIQKGMYYFKDDKFIFEHMENNTSDFKTSIKINELKEFIKTILESRLENINSKKNK